jgi:hypothetical protein
MIDIESLLSPYGPAFSYAADGGSLDTHDIALMAPSATPLGTPIVTSVATPEAAPTKVDVAPANGKHRASVPIDSMMVEAVPIQIGRLSA